MNAISAKRYLFLLSILAVLLAAGAAFLNWRIDPLQFYRKAAYPPDFSSQARYQNPGLARNYPYNTVIIGTSVSLGFDLRGIHDALGCQPLNLAMQGASAHEQRLILDVALRSGRVGRVVWDVNYEFLRGAPDWVSDYDGAFPGYFYDENRFNEIPNYLLNIDTTKSSLRIAAERALGKRRSARSLEELSRLSENRKPGRQSVLEAWERVHRKGWAAAKDPAEFAPERTRTSFDRNYLEVIKAHPEIRFDLWFPPFSFAYHALMREQVPAAFDEMFRWKAYVLERTRGLPNVRVYDFQGRADIVLDLNHYVDTVHFDAPTHNEIVQAIAAGRDLATPESLASAEDLIRREAQPDWARSGGR